MDEEGRKLQRERSIFISHCGQLWRFSRFVGGGFCSNAHLQVVGIVPLSGVFRTWWGCVGCLGKPRIRCGKLGGGFRSRRRFSQMLNGGPEGSIASLAISFNNRVHARNLTGKVCHVRSLGSGPKCRRGNLARLSSLMRLRKACPKAVQKQGEGAITCSIRYPKVHRLARLPWTSPDLGSRAGYAGSTQRW